MRCLLTTLVVLSTLLSPVNAAARVSPECDAVIAYGDAYGVALELAMDGYYIAI